MASLPVTTLITPSPRVNAKRPSADTQNIYCPRADRAEVIATLNNTANLIGHKTGNWAWGTGAGAGVGLAGGSGSSFASDPDGIFGTVFATAGTGWMALHANGSGSAQSFPWLTAVFLVRVAGGVGTAQNIMSCGANTTDGTVRVYVPSSSNDVRMTIREGTDKNITVSGVLGSAAWHVVVIRVDSLWGAELLVDSFANRTADNTVLRAMNVSNGAEVRLGASSTGTNILAGHFGFATFFSTRLTDRELLAYFTDPLLPSRPLAPVADFAYACNPEARLRKTNAVTFNCPTNLSATSTCRIRAQTRRTTGSSWTTAGTPASGSTPARRLEHTIGTGDGVVSGEGIEHVSVLSWSTDGTNYYPFPGGPIFWSTLGGQKALLFSDPHIASTVDNASAGARLINENMGTKSGSRKTLAVWKTLNAMFNRESGVHQIIDVNDTFHFDAVDISGSTADETQAHWDLAQVVNAQLPLLTSMGAALRTTDNHGKHSGYQLYADDDAPGAHYKQVKRIWREISPNPKPGDYDADLNGVECGAGASGDDYYSGQYWRANITTDSLGNAVDPATYYDEADGRHASQAPRTYGAYVDGPAAGPQCMFILLDPYSNADVGDKVGGNVSLGTGGQHVRDNRPWNFDPAQWQFLMDCLNARLELAIKHCVVILHQAPGGQASAAAVANSSKYYGHGERIGPVCPETRRLYQTCAAHAVDAICLGHDHKAAFCVSYGGMGIVSLPTAGAPSHSTQDGWHQFTDMYGHAETFGEGVSENMLGYWNAMGYMRMTWDATRVTFTFVQTEVAREVKTGRIPGAAPRLDIERFVSVTPFSGTSTSTDVEQEPFDVSMVADAAETWEDPPTQLYTEFNPADDGIEDDDTLEDHNPDGVIMHDPVAGDRNPAFDPREIASYSFSPAVYRIPSGAGIRLRRTGGAIDVTENPL